MFSVTEYKGFEVKLKLFIVLLEFPVSYNLHFQYFKIYAYNKEG